MSPDILSAVIRVLEQRKARGVRYVELGEAARETLYPQPRPSNTGTRVGLDGGPGRPQPNATNAGELSSVVARTSPPPAGPGVVPRDAAELRTTPPPAPRQGGPEPTTRPPAAATSASAAWAAAPEAGRGPVDAMDWSALEHCVRGCRKCPLHSARTQTVFGEGSLQTALMFVGEGPGEEEDRAGRPFVGPAGRLLDRMIQAMQFRRDEVLIANVVKCRPPANRTPTPAEVSACLPYLERQIALVRPQFLVLLGATPLLALTGKKGILQCHGEWLEYRGIPALPTFHPAFILRLPEKRRDAWADLKKVMLRLGKDPDLSVAAARKRAGPPDGPAAPG